MYLLKKKWILLTILILIPLGISTKFYHGIASSWVNNSLGDVIYVIFWSLLFSLVFPNTNPRKIAIIVFLITSLIEIMQLWHPPFLELIRSNFIGRSFLGTSFCWLDFFHYFIGLILSFGIFHLQRKFETANDLEL